MANQFEYGEVLLAEYPFTDRSSGKLRPVLVISGKDFNRGDDIVVLPISSRLAENDPFGFPILDSAAYFRSSGLRWSSSVKWTKPMTISADVIERSLGSLPESVVAQIVEKMLTMFCRAPLLGA
jgi:mRNA-degrading endonuclease toxin of MazEF toxin-antitoxin module